MAGLHRLQHCADWDGKRNKEEIEEEEEVEEEEENDDK